MELDLSITGYVPDAPQAWNPITLHHLLTHTSGIPEFLGFADFQSRKTLPSPLAETILRFRDLPLEFSPGTEGKYSNSGYVLLASVVEHISGETFERFCSRGSSNPQGSAIPGWTRTAGKCMRFVAGRDRIFRAP